MGRFHQRRLDTAISSFFFRMGQMDVASRSIFKLYECLCDLVLLLTPLHS